GKAARRLARPARGWARIGPRRGKSARKRSGDRSRSRRRVSLCRPTASRPAAASMSHFEPRANRLLKGWNCKAIRRSAPSERDDDLAEHLPALKPRKAALEVGERDLSVDHRPHAPRHLGKTLANVAQ